MNLTISEKEEEGHRGDMCKYYLICNINIDITVKI